MPRGQCTLPPDESGRILDRLAGLEQIIPPEAVRQALQATGRVNPRRCRLTHEVIFWVVLAMGMLTDLPIRQVFKHARGSASARRRPIAPASAWPGNGWASRRCATCSSRSFIRLARPETPGAFYRGFRLMGIDGTVFDVPDSEANAAAFGRPSAGPRGDGAFPQVRKLSLVELGTHVEVAFVVQSCPRRAVDGRRLASPSDAGDAPAGGPRVLQLRTTGKRLKSRGVKLLARVKSG